jgi:MFS family permease
MPAGNTSPKNELMDSHIQRITLIASTAGWLFAGLNMHIYTLAGSHFVASIDKPSDLFSVKVVSGIIQACFLIGWALGGPVIGRLGDLQGRRRTFILTILLYSIATGMSAWVNAWWQLALLRFLTGLGVGGVWALSTTYIVETWHQRSRSWLAATLQTGVSIGMILACILVYEFSESSPRSLFFIGFIPLAIIPWLFMRLPETEEWQLARKDEVQAPSYLELLKPPLLQTTCVAFLTSSLALTGHWAFMYWFIQHLRELAIGEYGDPAAATRIASLGLFIVIVASIVGNYVAGALSHYTSFKLSIIVALAAYAASLILVYYTERTSAQILELVSVIGVCVGVFALFTTYLPSLFPTLLRSYGAGLTYNVGRVIAAVGTIVFGLLIEDYDYRPALLGTSVIFVLASASGFLLPKDPSLAGTSQKA